MKNILEVIKKAPKDHVYYCTVLGECRCSLYEDNLAYPINCVLVDSKDCNVGVSLTSDGRYYAFEKYSGAERVLFPSRDNRDWEAFERELDGVKDNDSRFNPPAYGTDSYKDGVFSGYCKMGDMIEINLNHEYYKEHPYIDFQIDGKEYKVSIEDMKRLAMGNADNKTEHMSGQSFDGTAEMVSIPDRPMMAAVIMSGMLAGGCKDKGAALVNKALHLADLILDETETKTKEE